jgi:hypothetical protein
MDLHRINLRSYGALYARVHIDRNFVCRNVRSLAADTYAAGARGCKAGPGCVETVSEN